MKSKTSNAKTLKKRLLLLFLPAAALIAVLLYKAFDVKYTGHHEGIFLLKGGKGSLFEIKDDLYLGDGSRYVFGLDFDRFMSCRKGDFGTSSGNVGWVSDKLINYVQFVDTSYRANSASTFISLPTVIDVTGSLLSPTGPFHPTNLYPGFAVASSTTDEPRL